MPSSESPQALGYGGSAYDPGTDIYQEKLVMRFDDSGKEQGEHRQAVVGGRAHAACLPCLFGCLSTCSRAGPGRPGPGCLAIRAAAWHPGSVPMQPPTCLPPCCCRPAPGPACCRCRAPDGEL